MTRLSGEWTMTPDEYLQLALRTEAPIPEAGRHLSRGELRILHGKMGCATESGEMMDAYKRFLFYGKATDRMNIIEEMGDNLWYLAIICDQIGVSFAEVMERNINKLRTRFPNKFTEADALNRDLNAERAALEGGWTSDPSLPGRFPVGVGEDHSHHSYVPPLTTVGQSEEVAAPVYHTNNDLPPVELEPEKSFLEKAMQDAKSQVGPAVRRALRKASPTGTPHSIVSSDELGDLQQRLADTEAELGSVSVLAYHRDLAIKRMAELAKKKDRQIVELTESLRRARAEIQAMARPQVAE